MKFPPNLKATARPLGELPNGVIVWRSRWEGSIVTGPSGGGARETLRRRHQILAGTLTRTNGLTGGLDAIAEAREFDAPSKVILAGGAGPAGPGFFSRLRRKLAA